MDGSPISDGNGLYPEPFQFYFTAGKHIIRMNFLIEPMAIDEIRLTSPEQLPSYNEMEQAYEAQGYEPV